MHVRFYVHAKYFLSTNLCIVQEIDVSKQRRNMNTSTTLNKKTMISREAFIAGIAALFIAMVMITGCSSAKSKVVGAWSGSFSSGVVHIPLRVALSELILTNLESLLGSLRIILVSLRMTRVKA